MKKDICDSSAKFRVSIADRVVVETVEKRSRFIATAIPARKEIEALKFIGEMKEKYKDATHNVFAYYIDFGVFARYSDDGERARKEG